MGPEYEEEFYAEAAEPSGSKAFVVRGCDGFSVGVRLEEKRVLSRWAFAVMTGIAELRVGILFEGVASGVDSKPLTRLMPKETSGLGAMDWACA